MEIPEEARAAMRRLGAAQRRRRARLEHEERRDRRRRATERRERQAQLPNARLVLGWAKELADSGALEGAPDGVPVYDGYYTSVTVTPDGSLNVKHSSKLGYGATYRDVSTPEELVRRLGREHLTAIGERIRSGRIWDDVARLATRLGQSPHLRKL